MSVQVDLSGLRAALKAKGDQMIARGAANSAKFMYEEFERAIDFFYGSYSPMQYQRHYNMGRGGEPYTRGYKSGLRFGGVKLDAGNIPAVYHDSPDYVFFQSTMEGWHGGAGIFSSPSPMQMLREALDVAASNARSLIR